MNHILLHGLALVLVTPTIRAEVVTLPSSADTTLYAESGALSNGAGTHFFCGVNQLNNARRGLVRFDVAGSLPAGATVHSVELVLHLSQQNSPAELVTIHVVSQSWGEGLTIAPGAEGIGGPALANDATWTERFFGAGTPWATPGGTSGPTVATTLVAGIGDWSFQSSELVGAVQAMLAAPLTDFGFLVRGPEGAPGSAMRFDTRENAALIVRPRLVVTFTPPCPTPATYCVGAPNSVGSGASIGWSGSQSLALNGFTLTVIGAPPAAHGLFFYGPGRAALPFGDGVRCVATPIRRLGIQSTDASGACARTLNFSVPTASEIAAGSTWFFQFHYRDLAPGGAGFNLSNGLQASFCP